MSQSWQWRMTRKRRTATIILKKRLEEDDDENGKRRFLKEDELSKKSCWKWTLSMAQCRAVQCMSRIARGVESEASPSCCATRQALEAKRERRIVIHQVAVCGTRMMCKKLSS